MSPTYGLAVADPCWPESGGAVAAASRLDCLTKHLLAICVCQSPDPLPIRHILAAAAAPELLKSYQERPPYLMTQLKQLSPAAAAAGPTTVAAPVVMAACPAAAASVPAAQTFALNAA